MAKTPETKVKFSIFNEEFNKGMAEMGQESTKLRKEFKLQEEQMKESGSASDKLKLRIEKLGAEQAIVKRKIEATKTALEKNKRYFGENSNEAKKLANKLLDLKISEQKLGNAISGARGDLQKQETAFKNAKKSAEDYKKAIKDVGEKSKDAGDKVSGLALPIGGVGLAAGKMAVDIDGATRLLNRSLGATGDEADQLEQDLLAVWEDGFGDNPEAAARAMALVKQNIHGVNTGRPLQQVTKDAIILADTTDSDVGEVVRGVNQLMHNFGLTAEQSFDLFAKGNQEGLNYSNEMFDNIAEYAPKFKQAGFTAEEYFTILANGSQNGAYNLDYINDLMNEFDTRMRDGSKTTSQAFGQMSKSTQKVFQNFRNGKATASDLFNAIIPELQGMDDQVKANQIGVALFGTKFEDMGAKTVYSLDNTNTALHNTKGTMDSVAQSAEQSFGTKLSKALRGLGAALKPIGVILINLLLQILPYVQKFADWFAKLDPVIQKVAVAVGVLIAALGPIFAVLGFVISGLASFFGAAMRVWNIIKRLSIVFRLLRIVFLALSGPVGIVIAIIAALVTVAILVWTHWSQVKSWLVKSWNTLKIVAQAVFSFIGNFLKRIFGTIKIFVIATISSLVSNARAKFLIFRTAVSTILNAVKNFFVSIWRAISSTVVHLISGLVSRARSSFSSFRSGIVSILNSVRSFFSSIFNRIRSTVVNAVSSLRSKAVSIVSNLRSRFSSIFNSIRSTASSVFNRVKSAITSPIESAVSFIRRQVSRIKGFFSNLSIKLPHIPLPRFHISGSVDLNPVGGIHMPHLSVTWHKTGGVMTKPFTAGNAGFGDVEEAIVPFQGSHAMKIAKLIAEAQNKLSQGLAEKAQSLLLNINLQPSDVVMDGEKVGKQVWKPVKTHINRNSYRAGRGMS